MKTFDKAWRNSKKTEKVGVTDETLTKTKQKQKTILLYVSVLSYIHTWTSDITNYSSYSWSERDMRKKVDY